MNEVNTTRQYGRIEANDAISFPALAFCIVLFLILGITPFLNSSITMVIRPAIIMICLMCQGRYKYGVNKAIAVLVLYLLYMTAVLFSHQIIKSTFSAWASAVLFGLFFIVLSQRIWSAKEIRMIFAVAFISSVVYSLLLSNYNHDLFHVAETLLVNGKKVNSNAAAYTVAPGAICGFVLLFNYKNRRKSVAAAKALIFLGISLDMYTLLALGQRGGFFGACVGAALIIWESAGKKGGYRLILILLIAALLYAGPKLTEGTHAERLFDYEHLLEDNGREDLNRRAKQMIKEKPVFGGGYGYWENESGIDLGLHNGFLYIMVIGGYTAGFLVGLFLLYFLLDTLRQKSLIPLAFLFVAAVHLFEDSGLDYYSYIPMILAYILVRYASFRNTRTANVFCV